MLAQRAPPSLQVFPDIGVAAYLKRTWTDAEFRLASLNDRKPVVGDEDLVIVAAADPQGAGDCVKLAEMVPPTTPLVLFNARLVSGAQHVPSVRGLV